MTFFIAFFFLPPPCFSTRDAAVRHHRRPKGEAEAECDMAQRAEALKEEINRIKSDYEQLLAQNASLIRHISFGRFRRLCSPVSSNSGRQPSTSPSPAMIA
nr:bZIP transcription factor 16-like isoform X1 [Ipomoea batatas]